MTTTQKTTKKAPAALAAAAPATKAAKARQSPEKVTKAAPVEKAVKAKTAPVEKESKAMKPKKPNGSKVIRDSFTFPQDDYQKISMLKKNCLALGIHAKKSEILRAGLNLLAGLDQKALGIAIRQVEKIKTGRPLGSEQGKKS